MHQRRSDRQEIGVQYVGILADDIKVKSEKPVAQGGGGLSVCQSQVPADVDSHIIVLQEMQGHDAAPNASLGLKRKAAVFGARTTLFAGHQAWLNVLPSRFNQA